MAASMVAFGPKQAWLAVRDREPAVVMAALGARDLGPVDWQTGIDLAYLNRDRFFVTPPLRGAGDHEWVMVAGRGLMRETMDVAGLSGLLDTEVQYFSTYRVSEAHHWVRAEGGTTTRSFGWVGESGTITDWIGDPDGFELDLRLPARRPDDDDDETFVLIGEDDVFRLAGAWSVNPSELSGRPSPGEPHTAAID